MLQSFSAWLTKHTIILINVTGLSLIPWAPEEASPLPWGVKNEELYFSDCSNLKCVCWPQAAELRDPQHLQDKWGPDPGFRPDVLPEPAQEYLDVLKVNAD